MRQSLLPVVILSFLILSCNDTDSSETTSKTKSNAENVVATTETKAAVDATPSADNSTIAVIDVNGVLIKLHKLIKFEPKGNQFLKTDNSKYDYYVMDLSIANTTATTINSGTEFAFNIDIAGQDGKKFLKIDPGAKVLSLYEMEVVKKDQAQYEKLWGKIGAGEEARSLFRGYEVPKNTVIAKLVYENPANGTKKEQPITE